MKIEIAPKNETLHILLTLTWVLFFSVNAFSQQPSLPIKQNSAFNFKKCENIQYKSSFTPSNEHFRSPEVRQQEAQCLKDLSHSFLSSFLSHGSTSKITDFSESDLTSVIKELRANPFFPHDLIESGNCVHRANLIAFYFFNRGIQVSRIFARGNLYTRGPLYQSGVRWYTHVAILVPVKDWFKTKEMVVDPSLSEKALTIAEWIHLIDQKEIKNKIEIYKTGVVAIENLLSNDISEKTKESLLQDTTRAMILDIFETFDSIGPIPDRYKSKISELLPYLYFYKHKLPKFPQQTLYRSDD